MKAVAVRFLLLADDTIEYPVSCFTHVCRFPNYFILMSCSSGCQLLDELSRTSSAVEEYIAIRALLQSHPHVSELTKFENWHCVAQCCSVLLKCNSEKENEIVTFIRHQLTSHPVSCDRHCLCEIFHLITRLQLTDDLFVVYDALLPHCSGSKRCFLLPCITILADAVNSFGDDQSKLLLLDRIQSLRQFLPEAAVNFVGEKTTKPGPKSCEHRAYACACLKIIVAIDSKDSEWKKQQLFILSQSLVNGIETEKISNVMNRLVEVCDDDDEKLIFATKCMMKILHDLSDDAAVHDLIHRFMSSICFDHKVLMDWMMSDADTSVELLSLLVSYLKMDCSAISDQVRQVLIQLRISVQKLAQKNVFPYNADPLLRLMRDL